MTRNDVLDTLAILANQVIAVKDGSWARSRLSASPEEATARAETYARAAQRFAQHAATYYPEL
jgi:hypothetical protein